MTIIQVLFCVFFPAVALWAGERFRVARFVGPVTLCYVVGVLTATARPKPVPPLRSKNGSRLASGVDVHT